MSVASLAIGDIIVPLEILGGDYGDTPTAEQAAYELECRIDTMSTGETRGAKRADSQLRYTSYHATNPSLDTGMVVMWVATGAQQNGDRYDFPKPKMLRVLGSGFEGRPGEVPMLWWVEYVEDTAEQVGDIVDA